MFRYCSLTITDRFHGTVFSLKSLTPVVSVDVNTEQFQGSGESKTRSLLRDFDLVDKHSFNVVTACSNMEKFLKQVEEARQSFDRKKVAEGLNKRREELNLFLQKVKCLHQESKR